MSAFTLKELLRLKQFEEVFKTALAEGSGRVELAKELHSYHRDHKGSKVDEVEFENQKKRLEELAALGQDEVSREFPYLHSLLVVRVCSILEAAVDECTTAALSIPAMWEQPETIRTIPIPLIEYTNLSEQHRAEYLLDELTKRTKATHQIGSGRFEALLTPVGLGGAIPTVVRRVFVELIECRNVIVHRDGKVDKQFKDRVPWSIENVGDHLEITNIRYNKFIAGALWYGGELMVRMARKNLMADLSVDDLPEVCRFRDTQEQLLIKMP
jgi:hypothetical protein